MLFIIIRLTFQIMDFQTTPFLPIATSLIHRFSNIPDLDYQMSSAISRPILLDLGSKSSHSSSRNLVLIGLQILDDPYENKLYDNILIVIYLKRIRRRKANKKISWRENKKALVNTYFNSS